MKAISIPASLNRIRAMVLRYVYLLRGSWARIFELVYWPTVQMVTWGFLQSYLGQASGGPNAPLALAGGILIGSMLLWDILLRGQLGFSIGFLEEMWSRNIGNLFMTKERRSERREDELVNLKEMGVFLVEKRSDVPGGTRIL